VDRVEKQFFAEYLFSRALVYSTSQDELSAAIRESVFIATQLDGHDDHHSEYARLLWTAVAEHLTPLQIFGYLNPTKLNEWEFRTSRSYHVSNYLFSAAAILGKPEMFEAATHVSKLEVSTIGYKLLL
jgi:hypothetical protein